MVGDYTRLFVAVDLLIERNQWSIIFLKVHLDWLERLPS